MARIEKVSSKILTDGTNYLLKGYDYYIPTNSTQVHQILNILPLIIFLNKSSTYLTIGAASAIQ